MPIHPHVRLTRMASTGAVALVSTALLIANAPGASAVDTSNKVSVANAYLNNLVPAHKVSVGWTGSVSGCKAGSTSAAQRHATKTAINFYRGMGGLKPVSLDSSLTAKAQQAALMMKANKKLSHAPASSWKCASSTGKEAAGNSNLALGSSGAQAISKYMLDPGSSNNMVGHRRWIMYPPTKKMGSGSTSTTNALWVLGGGWVTPSGTPSFVAWPNAGYFPAPLEPKGRWSLSATGDVDFSKATISVKDSSGRALKVTKQPVVNGYGSNTVVFQVSGLKKPAGTATASYSVQVANFTRTGSSTKITRNYTVKIFNPDKLAKVKNTKRAYIVGTTKVGKKLSARVGSWSPAAKSYSYRWVRNGVPISGATAKTYKLTKSDKGKKISVQVTAKRSGKVNGVSTSTAKKIS